MIKYSGLLILMLMISVGVFAQEVKGVHKVEPSGKSNGYNIKTTISGLQGVDIARIIYLIDNSHTYVPSPTNTFFSDRNEKYVKFYVMAVPTSGEIIVDLGVEVANSGEFAFQVEFQYSKNEEKKTIDLPRVYLTSDQDIVAEESAQESGDNAIASEVLALKVASEEKAKETAEADRLEEETKAKEMAAEKEAEALALKVASEEKAKEAAEAERLEEETKAKEMAAEKEAEALVLKVASEEKAKEAVEADRLVEETKSKEIAAEKEAEALALKVASEEKAKEAAESEKLAEETKAKEIAAEKEAEALALKVASEEKAKEAAENKNTSNNTYTIQLLSLSKFSQERLNYYCKKHKLDIQKIGKKKSGEWMKITYGKFNTKEEAKMGNRELAKSHGISDAFVVVYR
jgi:hypothetical protein